MLKIIARAAPRELVVGCEYCAQRIEHVLPCLRSSAALAESPRNLQHTRDDPALLVGLIECDREIDRRGHENTVALRVARASRDSKHKQTLENPMDAPRRVFQHRRRGRIRISQARQCMSEFVYVPVPSEHVQAVYRLLASVGRGSNESTGQAPNAVDATELPDPELVKRMYRESYEGHRQLMVLLAQAPGEWIHTEDIARTLDIAKGARGVAGMLGAFGRRSKHRYGHKKPWISEWDGVREEARHMMPVEVAQVINSIVANA